MSDINALPKANVCLFQLRLTSFASAEVRQKVYDHVTKNLPEERFQTLTKQQIIDYAKSKNINEKEGDDGPEAMLGHACADKVFEIIIALRG